MSDPTPDPLDDIYHGTRGSSGSYSSEDAAYADLVNGVTNVTQRYVLILAQNAGAKGITVAEVREKDGKLHHGRISSALTKQHIAGKLVALYERRGYCGVYVLPEHVNGRAVRPYRRQKGISEDAIIGALLHHHRNFPDQLCLAEDCDWQPGSGVTWSAHQAEKIAEALS